MKAVILAGGLGTRLAEETYVRPKPMVEVGGRPLLWHIMKTYSHYGINEFIICLGYLSHVVKNFFANYQLQTSDVTFDFKTGETTYFAGAPEPWRVTLVDTGADTMTGGRLKRVKQFIGNETFMLTYGDGLSDVDINALLAHHKKSGKLATVTGVLPPGRFGVLELDNHNVTAFREKPDNEVGWINGGFFVLEPKVIDTIAGDSTLWEKEPMQKLAADGQMSAYLHHGFWQPVDTLRDKKHLEELWASGKAPWRKW